MNLPLAVLIPFLGAALVAWSPGRGRLWSAYAAGAVTAAALLVLLPPAAAVLGGETLLWRVDWLPAAGLA
ncbi:MAG: hypothetical protein P8106_04510, partial [Gammaproteobacteria bacterium]